MCSHASARPQTGGSLISPQKKVREKEALAEKSGADGVSVVAFAYEIYTTPKKTPGALRNTYRVARHQHLSDWVFFEGLICHTWKNLSSILECRLEFYHQFHDFNKVAALRKQQEHFSPFEL